jgi:hypothetical protein
MTFHEDQCTFFIISHSILLEMRVHTEIAEKIKTHFTFENYLFKKIVPFMRQCGKILQNQVDQGDNMAHVHCKLDT